MANEKEFKKQALVLEAIKILSEQRRSGTKKNRLTQILSAIKQMEKKIGVESLNPQFDFEQWIELKMIHEKMI